MSRAAALKAARRRFGRRQGERLLARRLPGGVCEIAVRERLGYFPRRPARELVLARGTSWAAALRQMGVRP